METFKMKSIKKIEFESELTLEYSYTPTLYNLGNAKSTMELFVSEDNLSGMIEWCYEFEDGNEDAEHIGLGFDENKTLTDYDGVFSLSKFAIQLIRECGFIVPEDFE
jgi:hypothetical protein